ncbi:hypothetical protein QVH35_04835 [Candidatus Nitrosotenuis chungbukensis]|nr:hypothetical protein [Candidatus Nitrosotenuis chungbukensis]WKT58688.1 hypothetical protein QVH35_04835 [Candidatus Nitrosotenuis chungbukensis]
MAKQISYICCESKFASRDDLSKHAGITHNDAGLLDGAIRKF